MNVFSKKSVSDQNFLNSNSKCWMFLEISLFLCASIWDSLINLQLYFLTIEIDFEFQIADLRVFNRIMLMFNFFNWLNNSSYCVGSNSKNRIPLVISFSSYQKFCIVAIFSYHFLIFVNLVLLIRNYIGREPIL